MIGNADQVVKIEWGRLSGELFKSMGLEKYLFKEYQGMPHGSSLQVMPTELPLFALTTVVLGSARCDFIYQTEFTESLTFFLFIFSQNN